MNGPQDGASPVMLFSPAHFRFFCLVFRRFAARHLRAVRLAAWGAPPPDAGDAPLVVYANHPSWWDGVAFMLLSTELFPGRRMIVPMEAAALARYGFMRRIGVFGVERHSARGAIAFLRTAEAVLAAPGHMLWMNAPGRFCDVRERPVPIAPGWSGWPNLPPPRASCRWRWNTPSGRRNPPSCWPASARRWQARRWPRWNGRPAPRRWPGRWRR
ncbi:lysophospholipid acyltransferase family protein [Siccirubricoccus deserti]